MVSFKIHSCDRLNKPAVKYQLFMLSLGLPILSGASVELFPIFFSSDCLCRGDVFSCFLILYLFSSFQIERNFLKCQIFSSARGKYAANLEADTILDLKHPPLLCRLTCTSRRAAGPLPCLESQCH